VPGCIIVKKINGAADWAVYHRGVASDAETDALFLNLTNAAGDHPSYWNDTAPTATEFTVGNGGEVNGGSGTYVAYLFAHNDGDGEFGPDGDADIIKCGSYTATGSPVDVDLGFEPQFIITRNVSRATEWNLQDTMRGMTDNSWTRVIPNDDAADFSVTSSFIFPTATGFKVTSVGNEFGNAGETVIYIAIRRGTKVPESGTEVFDIDTRTGNQPSFVASFEPDMAIKRNIGIVLNNSIAARLTGTGELVTNDTAAESSDAGFLWDYMDGWANDGSANSDVYSWMWKRAPSFCDVVCYTGNSTAGRTVSHNLGVAPEMMWVKRRSSSALWAVYQKDLGNTKYIQLQSNAAAGTLSTFWNDTSPTSTDFTVGTYTAVNGNADTFIAYLFASLPGISKVGSYTGNGTSQTIDCGFTSGARYVLIKRTDSSGDWNFYDTERGMVAGNDSRLSLNTTDAEDTSNDRVDSNSSGFTVNYIATGTSDSNISGASYIFYAIA
jgi:hypothetical protein